MVGRSFPTRWDSIIDPWTWNDLGRRRFLELTVCGALDHWRKFLSVQNHKQSTAIIKVAGCWISSCKAFVHNQHQFFEWGCNQVPAAMKYTVQYTDVSFSLRLYRILVLSLPHIEPKAHMRVKCQVGFGPYFVRCLGTRCPLPTRGRAWLRRLSLRHKSNRIESLEQTYEHERCLIICELWWHKSVGGIFSKGCIKNLLAKADARSYGIPYTSDYGQISEW